jgi:sugar lactone lactonase YvrE
MKTTLKTILSSLVTAALSLGIASTALADSTNLFASINGGPGAGAGFVYEYTPAGTQSTFLSGLNRPRGLAFGSGGNIFLNSTVIDGSGNYQGTVFQVAPDGTMTVFATGFGTNVFLEGLAFDSAGNIFVNSSDLTDPNNITGIVFKITPSGTVTTFGTVPGQAFGIAIDSADMVFAASNNPDRTIYQFTPAGVRSVFVGPTAFAASQGPVGLTFDSSGNLVVSTGDSPGNGEILKFAPDTTKTVFATGLTNAPRGLAYDSDGNLFVAEVPPASPGDILKFSPGGVRTTFASGIGSANGGAEYVTFKHLPCGCAGPAGPEGPQGPAGPQGPQGPAGAGLVSGSTLVMKQGSAAPAGFNKIGTTSFQYRDLTGKNQNVTLDVYQKP